MFTICDNRNSLINKVINKACDSTVGIPLTCSYHDVKPNDCRMMEERADYSENVTVGGTPGCSPGHVSAACRSLRSEHLHTSYVIISLSEKIMAGSAHIYYPSTHSACKSSMHKQKSYLLPLRLRGGNLGKWGIPPAPTSLIAGWYGLGMKECQVTRGHVVCCVLVCYAYPYPVTDWCDVVYQRLLVLQNFKRLYWQ